MLRKCFLVPMLGCLALLMFADLAHAQLRVRRATVRERRMERRGMVVTSADTAPSLEATSSVRVSNYFTPTNEGLANAAQIRMILPDAQARVWFDGAATKQEGVDRLFTTPTLTAGAANNYRIRATFMQDGREVTRERVVTVAPGMTYVLNFTRR